MAGSWASSKWLFIADMSYVFVGGRFLLIGLLALLYSLPLKFLGYRDDLLCFLIALLLLRGFGGFLGVL